MYELSGLMYSYNTSTYILSLQLIITYTFLLLFISLYVFAILHWKAILAIVAVIIQLSIHSSTILTTSNIIDVYRHQSTTKMVILILSNTYHDNNNYWSQSSIYTYTYLAKHFPKKFMNIPVP